MNEWIPMRHGLRWVAARCVQSWALGSGYRFHRNARGRVTRFWRAKSAQRFVDTLNAGETSHG